METRFKVGDRVRHNKHGDGTVKFFEPSDNHYAVEFDKETGWLHDGGGHCKVKQTSWQMAINLTLIESESDNANTNDPDPSRAMIAAMCLQGMLANPEWAKTMNVDDFDEFKDRVSNASVELADALIAELQKPKQ